jgi:hypothetical protein
LIALNLIPLRPLCNWDVIGYVGVAHAFRGAPSADLHARTYDDVGRFCGVDRPNLQQGGAYQVTVATDPGAFAEQLPFYSVKPVYPAAIALLAESGVNAAAASFFVSIAAYVGIAVTILLWLGGRMPLPWAIGGAWAIAALPFVLDLARLSTPDALSTLVVLVAFCLLFGTNRVMPALTALVGSVAIRPDNLLWLGVVGAYLFTTRPDRRTHVGTAILLGVVLYWGIARWSGTYAWSTWIYHGFVEFLPRPAGFASPLGPLDYLRLYLRESHPANLPRHVLLIVLIGLATTVVRARRWPGDPWIPVAAVVGGYMALHWLSFPDEDRYLTAAYVVILIAAAQTVYDLTRPVRGDGAPRAFEADLKGAL